MEMIKDTGDRVGYVSGYGGGGGFLRHRSFVWSCRLGGGRGSFCGDTSCRSTRVSRFLSPQCEWFFENLEFCDEKWSFWLGCSKVSGFTTINMFSMMCLVIFVCVRCVCMIFSHFVAFLAFPVLFLLSFVSRKLGSFVVCYPPPQNPLAIMYSCLEFDNIFGFFLKSLALIFQGKKK